MKTQRDSHGVERPTPWHRLNDAMDRRPLVENEIRPIPTVEGYVGDPSGVVLVYGYAHETLGRHKPQPLYGSELSWRQLAASAFQDAGPMMVHHQLLSNLGEPFTLTVQTWRTISIVELVMAPDSLTVCLSDGAEHQAHTRDGSAWFLSLPGIRVGRVDPRCPPRRLLALG